MLLRAKNKPKIQNISLGITGKQSRFNVMKIQSLKKTQQNPDMIPIDTDGDHIKQQIYFNSSGQKQGMVIREHTGSSQISRQNLTRNQSAFDEQKSKSSLRRNISLTKIDKQRLIEEIEIDDVALAENTFVREPMGHSQHSPVTKKTEMARNSVISNPFTPGSEAMTVVSKVTQSMP